MNGFDCRSTSRRACIKLDFLKAFDCVLWDAIKEMMKMMGFDDVFQFLILSCVHTSSFSVLVEGSLTSVFREQHDLHQGDPISPFIFIMVLEVLSKQLRKAVNVNKLELFINSGATVESHLAYTDDVLLFCHASRMSLQTLRNILDEFCDFFGLNINVQKSHITFSKVVEDKQDMMRVIGLWKRICH